VPLGPTQDEIEASLRIKNAWIDSKKKESMRYMVEATISEIMYRARRVREEKVALEMAR
jgi:hypothetical protein